MSMTRTRPTLAMVSTDIRRDLVAPLRDFARLRLVHFYRRAPYHDLAADEMDDSLSRYGSPLDLLRQLGRAEPDIIQGVEPFSIRQLPYHVAIYAYARSRRIPLLAGVHISRPLHEKYGRIPALLLRSILKPYLQFTRLFFYLNEGGRRNLLWMGVPEAKLVRHMYGTWGVDIDEFTTVRDGREPDWASGPVLLFVGRVHHEKGIFDLLEAYGWVRAAVPDTCLVVVGDGPARPRLEALVTENGWQHAVAFVGTIKNRDLPPLFRAATAFVSPSITTAKWEEYVGMTNIQAMACGLPVVSTCTGAIPEYVPDGVAGILVPQRDPQALAEAILRLLQDSTLHHQMGEAGRTYALEHYDARKNVGKAEEIILERCLRS
jgi:glycosyltransferase involved in cell wall biosynthesis